MPAERLIDGRFEIEEQVAQGGMGVVYRALDRATGKPVALKVSLAFGGPGDGEARFAREIRLLAEIEHVRVAGYVGHGKAADGRLFLAMEWIEGLELRARLAQGPLSMPDSLRVLRGAAEAMAAVHARGIVHRDLKPSNFLLRGGSTADLVLVDFGVSRRLDTSLALTGTAILGTPQYMAPEQVSSARQVLPSADVFSIGCVFYECLIGRSPFEASQVYGILARILYDEPEPPHLLDPSIPEDWSNLLGRMLDKRPSARPADGAALLRELSLLSPLKEPAWAGPRPPPSGARLSEPSDQVLVCVVLATPPGSASSAEAEKVTALRSAMQRFGCPLDRLVDGTFLATVSPRQSATDLVRIGARCAMYLREQMPGARIAVATGRAPLGPSQRIGDAVDRAAQLLAPDVSGDDIRLDGVTRGLLDARFITATRDGLGLLLGEQPDLDDSRPLLGKPTPCVGREPELIQLEVAVATAFDEKTPRAAVVVGPPGIGKSRLRHELTRRVRARYPDSLVLAGYGDPLSAGSPYAHCSDALCRHAGIRVGHHAVEAGAAILEKLCREVEPQHKRRVAEFLGELIGVPPAGEPSANLQAARRDHRLMSEEIALAFIDWLTAASAHRPVFFMFEDFQWGDALTVKLLESALRELEHGALFVLVLGRPEIEEVFRRLFGEHRAVSVSLGALNGKASELLVKGVLGADVSREALQRIVRLAAGNALFLEELIRAAAEGKAGDVPETVLAMLQARLSRLQPEPRVVLRAASVLGENFWRGGVQSICGAWGSCIELDRCLTELVDLELVTRLRGSRFPGDAEFSFRHALVCEAAGGLLTESDRQAAHLTAGRWLEDMGEADAVVLARHADIGGESERAIWFYTRAAEQSLVQYDSSEALARATRGISCGASGQALGVLRGIQTAALYVLASWQEGVAAGNSALELLPRGGALWCSTVERLMHMLPILGETKRNEELSHELLRIEPAPEARPAYLRAICIQLVGCAMEGHRGRGQACLDRIDELGAARSEPEAIVSGDARLWRALFTFMMGTDLAAALAENEQCVRELEGVQQESEMASQVMYRLSMAYAQQAFISWGAGAADLSERAARKGRAMAERMRDRYNAARAAWYLSLTLSEQADPAKLDEAEQCARAHVDVGVASVLASGLHRMVTARAALTRGDWARAEVDARAARPVLVGFPPFYLMASAHLLSALVRQGHGQEAAKVAREDLTVFKQTGSPMCSEVLFLVAAAEALYQGGDHAAASHVLDGALVQIERRSAHMLEPALRRSYLEGREENRRAADLQRAWSAAAAQ